MRKRGNRTRCGRRQSAGRPQRRMSMPISRSRCRVWPRHRKVWTGSAAEAARAEVLAVGRASDALARAMVLAAVAARDAADQITIARGCGAGSGVGRGVRGLRGRRRRHRIRARRTDAFADRAVRRRRGRGPRPAGVARRRTDPADRRRTRGGSVPPTPTPRQTSRRRSPRRIAAAPRQCLPGPRPAAAATWWPVGR